MNLVEMKRVERSSKETLSVVVVNKKILGMALECPERLNIPNESCIPAGVYTCNLVESPHFGLQYQVTNVTGRTHILFHSGNVADDTDGCILLGLSAAYLGSNRAVLNSADAIGLFKQKLESKPFKLIITDNF